MSRLVRAHSFAIFNGQIAAGAARAVQLLSIVGVGCLGPERLSPAFSLARTPRRSLMAWKPVCRWINFATGQSGSLAATRRAGGQVIGVELADRIGRRLASRSVPAKAVTRQPRPLANPRFVRRRNPRPRPAPHPPASRRPAPGHIFNLGHGRCFPRRPRREKRPIALTRRGRA